MRRALNILVVLIAVTAAAGVPILVYEAIKSAGSSSVAAANSAKAAANSRKAASRAKSAGSSAKKSSAATATALAAFKAESAQHRRQNLRELAQLHAQALRDHRLTLRVGQLAAERSADNARAIARESALSNANRRAVAAVAVAQSKITALEAATREESLRDQYNTCIAVDNLNKRMHHTLVAIFSAFKLSPSQQAGVEKLEAQFNPLVCHKP